MENLTEQERLEFEEFKALKAATAAINKRNEEVLNYKVLTNETINQMFPVLVDTSNNLKGVKTKVYESFTTLIELKSELFNVRENQMTHQFINEAGDKRIQIGTYTVDNYDDTCNEGIAMIKEEISAMARDRESEALVDTLLKLMSRDSKGNLKPSKVMELQNMANKLQKERIIEGVRIISESYRPIPSKTFIRAEYKDELGQWINIPLGITES